MTRNIDISLAGEITQTVIRPVYLVEIEVQDSIIYLCDALHDISWNGHTYLANGWLEDVAEVTETSDIRGQGVDITITGVSDEVNALMFINIRQNKYGRIYLGMINISDQLVATPYLLFIGRLDYPEINDSESESRIVLHYESQFVKLDKPSNLRYTDEAQKSMQNGAFAGDQGFAYVKKLVEDWNGYWGKPKPPPAQKDNKSQRKNPPRKTR